jgi:hypothetical protein
MNRKQIEEYIELYNPELEILLADGFDEAFLGIGQQFNNFFAIYDRFKCVEILAKDMTLEDAEEYFDFNVVGAYVGENTPVFVDIIQ